MLGWLAGHTHRTNATFTRRSTKDKTDDARKWHRHAGFVHAAARTGTITVLLAVTCGLAFARTATILALAVLVLIPVGAAGLVAIPEGQVLVAGEVGLKNRRPRRRPGRGRRLLSRTGRGGSPSPPRSPGRGSATGISTATRTALTQIIGEPPRFLRIEPDRSKVAVGMPHWSASTGNARRSSASCPRNSALTTGNRRGG